VADETVAYCTANNIKLLLLPAHTSHISQPLDVSVFAAYKAAYRRSVYDTSLKELVITNLNAATQNRVLMLGKSLIAYNASVTVARIRRGFEKTGLYPPSFDTFLYHAKSVTGVPTEVQNRSKSTVASIRSSLCASILGKRRINIVDQPLIVDCDA